MEINILIKNIKTKLLHSSYIENVIIEDKTYLHIKHLSHDKKKFHLKLTIFSNDLKKISKLEATKKVHSILQEEIKHYIHSIQIFFN